MLLRTQRSPPLDVIPAEAGIHRADAAAVAPWTPVFTGVTCGDRVFTAIDNEYGAKTSIQPEKPGPTDTV
jgi:hypothetical protein